MKKEMTPIVIFYVIDVRQANRSPVGKRSSLPRDIRNDTGIMAANV